MPTGSGAALGEGDQRPGCGDGRADRHHATAPPIPGSCPSSRCGGGATGPGPRCPSRSASGRGSSAPSASTASSAIDSTPTRSRSPETWRTRPASRSRMPGSSRRPSGVGRPPRASPRSAGSSRSPSIPREVAERIVESVRRLFDAGVRRCIAWTGDRRPRRPRRVGRPRPGVARRRTAPRRDRRVGSRGARPAPGDSDDDLRTTRGSR